MRIRMTNVQTAAFIAAGLVSCHAAAILLSTSEEVGLVVAVYGLSILLAGVAFGLIFVALAIGTLWASREERQFMLRAIGAFALMATAMCAPLVLFAFLWPSYGWLAGFTYAGTLLGMPAAAKLLKSEKRHKLSPAH